MLINAPTTRDKRVAISYILTVSNIPQINVRLNGNINEKVDLMTLMSPTSLHSFSSCSHHISRCRRATVVNTLVLFYA